MVRDEHLTEPQYLSVACRAYVFERLSGCHVKMGWIWPAIFERTSDLRHLVLQIRLVHFLSVKRARLDRSCVRQYLVYCWSSSIPVLLYPCLVWRLVVAVFHSVV